MAVAHSSFRAWEHRPSRGESPRISRGPKQADVGVVNV